MHKRTVFLSVAAVVVLGGWYAFRPERAFIDQSVNEPLPLMPMAQPTGSAMSNAANAASIPPSSAVTGSLTAISSGRFHGVHHKTEGLATVYRLADGTRIVRFTDFSTSNGPDVRIFLVAANDALDNASVEKAGFVELGPMKGNKGDQNYVIPASVDLSKYHAVTVWCKRFAVNFATAPLSG